jgi:glutaredoxin 2
MRKRKKATSMRKRKNKARSEQNLPETDTIIRSVDDDIEKVESLIILQRKTLLKNSKDVYKPYRLFTELTLQHH